jgi:hypothetical protein
MLFRNYLFQLPVTFAWYFACTRQQLRIVIQMVDMSNIDVSSDRRWRFRHILIYCPSSRSHRCKAERHVVICTGYEEYNEK